MSGNSGCFLIKSCPADAKRVYVCKLDAALFDAFWIEAYAIQTILQLFAVHRASLIAPAIGKAQGEVPVGTALDNSCGLRLGWQAAQRSLL